MDKAKRNKVTLVRALTAFVQDEITKANGIVAAAPEPEEEEPEPVKVDKKIAPRKRRRSTLKYDPNPNCKGVFVRTDKDMPCKGGAKANKIVDYDGERVCGNCARKCRAWTKQHDKGAGAEAEEEEEEEEEEDEQD